MASEFDPFVSLHVCHALYLFTLTKQLHKPLLSTIILLDILFRLKAKDVASYEVDKNLITKLKQLPSKLHVRIDKHTKIFLTAYSLV